MISRLTTFAVTFATLASGSIALAAAVSTTAVAPAPISFSTAAKSVRVIELPRVTVVARRLPA